MIPFLINTVALLATYIPDIFYIDEFPNAYYQLLRWLTCGVAIYGIYQAFKLKKLHKYHGWAFVVVAVVFNPIAPIEMERETWLWVDGLAIIILLVTPSIWLFAKLKSPPYIKVYKHWLNSLKRFAIGFLKLVGILVGLFALLIGGGYGIFKGYVWYKENSAEKAIKIIPEKHSIPSKKVNDKQCQPCQKVEYADYSRFANNSMDKTILCDIYGGSIMKKDSINHIINGDNDGYLGECSSVHVHRVINKTNNDIAVDTVYSRILKVFKVGNDTLIALIETYSPNNNCHACGALISAVVYSFSNNKWQLAIQDSLAYWGDYGTASDDVINFIRPGKEIIGIEYFTDYMTNGETEVHTEIYAFFNGKFNSVWGKNTGGGNFGNCDDKKGDCWEYEVSFTFVKSDKDWYDMYVETKGTQSSDHGRIISVNAHDLFSFNGAKYIAKNTFQ